MSLYDYQMARLIDATDPPFYALIMAAMRKADTDNAERLRAAFPEVWEEVQHRYWSAGALLPGEPGYNPRNDDYLPVINNRTLEEGVCPCDSPMYATGDCPIHDTTTTEGN